MSELSVTQPQRVLLEPIADKVFAIIDAAGFMAVDRKLLLESAEAEPICYGLFEWLPLMPRFGVVHVCSRLEATFPTGSAAVKTLEDLGILAEVAGQKTSRVYGYQGSVELLSR